jgi:hypothetical protein
MMRPSVEFRTDVTQEFLPSFSCVGREPKGALPYRHVRSYVQIKFKETIRKGKSKAVPVAGRGGL